MSNWGIESYDIKLRYIFAGKNSKLNKKFFGQKACSLREITLKGRHLVQIYTNCLLLYHKLSISALLRILLRREHLKEKWGKRSQGEILRQPRSGDFSNAHYPTSKLLPPPPIKIPMFHTVFASMCCPICYNTLRCVLSDYRSPLLSRVNIGENAGNRLEREVKRIKRLQHTLIFLRTILRGKELFEKKGRNTICHFFAFHFRGILLLQRRNKGRIERWK